MRKSKPYLLILLLLALVYFFYRFRNSIAHGGFRWGVVVESLHHARLSFIILSIVLIYAGFALRAVRWMRFCRWMGPTNFLPIYGATLMGFSCTFVLGRAGEPIRPVLIARKSGFSVSGMFGVYVLERLADVAATIVIAGSALLLFQHQTLPGESGALMKIARSAGLLLLVGLIGAIAFLTYFRYHGAAWLTRKLQEPKWRHGLRGKVVLLLEGFIEGLQGIRTWGDLGALAGYTVAHWVLVVMIYWLVPHAFSGDVANLSWSGVILVLSFGLVGSTVQFPGVGGGTQVATILVFTRVLGIDIESATTVSIVLWLVSFASCCLVGLPLLFREGWSMGDLTRMAQSEEQAGEAELLAEAELAATTAGKNDEKNAPQPGIAKERPQ